MQQVDVSSDAGRSITWCPCFCRVLFMLQLLCIMCVIRHLECKMWIRCFSSWLQASVLVIKKTVGLWPHAEMRLVRWSIIYYHTSASTEWQMPITEIGLQRSMLVWWPQHQLQRLEWFYTCSLSLQG